MSPARPTRFAPPASAPTPSSDSAPAAVSPDPSSPFGVYVHFPFCKSRCHYCAFYFVVGRAEVRDRYVDAVTNEAARVAGDPRFAGREAHSVYFGGGTPSLLPPADVARVVDAVRASFPLRSDAEISLEANPEGLTGEHLRALGDAGVNRLTLGWQSLRKENLRLLTRTHSADDAERALENARAAGFGNVGVDLIFGVPGQTVAAWEEELTRAAALGPEHVSAYELTLEEGTRLAKRHATGRYPLPGEDERARMFNAAGDVLEAHGVHRYEISNFARPGFECRHNLSGWRSGDLLGLGASAASHVTNARWTNLKDLDEYARRMEAGESVLSETEVLDEATWAAEDLYLGLRTSEGIDAGARLERLEAAAATRLRGVLEAAVRDGLAADDGRIRLTRRGRLLADTVFDALLTV
ncbi:radical SAM family heme chaperone HemW [bacterium]|nr:radical SAM family heme chaperone HemW [bacterium]